MAATSLCTTTSTSTHLFLDFPKLKNPIFSNYFLPRRSITGAPARPSVRMVSNGFFQRENKKESYSKIYKRVGSCLVIPPPKGRKPKGIIKFLGGAFIGAVPEVSYSYLLELLANEGYLIISVPYNVTFDHSRACREIYEKFFGCFDGILETGLPDFALTSSDLVDLPIYCVGHSNGALLQVLIGSNFSEKIPRANAIISYNNRPATEAVPYFEQLGPLLSQMMPVVEASPISSMAKSASAFKKPSYYIKDLQRIPLVTFPNPVAKSVSDFKENGDAWKMLLDTAEAMTSDFDPEARVSLNKFADQLPSVFNQVAEGISEFKPTPLENRDCFKKSYNVQRTLLVKFDSDTIDETDLLEETLKPRVASIGGTLEKVSLSGNHITPCIQEPKWEAGYVYTPADAIAQGLKTISLNDTKVLSRTVADWLSSIER